MIGPTWLEESFLFIELQSGGSLVFAVQDHEKIASVKGSNERLNELKDFGARKELVQVPMENQSPPMALIK